MINKIFASLGIGSAEVDTRLTTRLSAPASS